ncbi:hypothetical protein SAMN05421821_102421 [Mucilaginibacter lappiensis]|uniref:DUF4249 family protein n=1 Tax=Mucilaginibacter lappiensis TaxID=354630 RepID=A0ABR6PF20_9SPHI|nr:hypothetical protein [Mucilaginibacter lappiensis]MBB6108342.1 hypothetical protein [Mucilaginibacter lappiensis]SIQ41554.1 hypothetical protein SAMN05421821_102421 [Mucilaginibacter lappiensis]
MIKLKYLPLVFALFLLACKKEQLLNPNPPQTVNLTIKGYITTKDTLEFVLNNKVLGQGFDAKITLNATLFNAGDKIQIRKKADSKIIGNIDVAASPFNQVKKIFYDGTTLSNNIELTPVTNPENMGIRLRFSTTATDFYGGPVDIEIFEYSSNNETYESTYRSIKEAKNVTGAFGDFIELEPLTSTELFTKGYKIKVYKAGTKELPYTSMDHVFLDDPDNNYSDVISFTAGESKLLSVSPSHYEEAPGDVVSGYQIEDISFNFK